MTSFVLLEDEKGPKFILGPLVVELEDEDTVVRVYRLPENTSLR